jgi:hypothetical protein
MHNIRSVPLALQFPLSEGFKPRIVEEDLISFFILILVQPFVIPPLILSLYMLVEIGPEGWTPTQQPPEFSPSLRLRP